MLDWTEEVPQLAEMPRQYHCGEYHRKLNPHTGQYIWNRWYCRKYHTCSICQGLKQKALREKITPLLSDPQIRVIVHNQDIADLNKEYSERLHIPKENGVFYTLVRTDKEIGKPLTPEMADEIAQYAVAPQGRRISGNLGKKPAPIKTEDIIDFPEEVKRRVFKYSDKAGHDIDNDLAHKIEAETIAETADLDPKTALQVQDAIYVREQKTIEIAAKYEIEILFLSTETITIYESQINWQQERNARIRPPIPS